MDDEEEHNIHLQKSSAVWIKSIVMALDVYIIVLVEQRIWQFTEKILVLT